MRDWTPEEIMELRKTYKLSKAKLAELTGVSKNYIYYLEKGVKRPSKTLKLVLGYVEKDLTGTGNEKGKGGTKHGKGHI
jgi:DNA-binding transcriptional regulator YiaG